MSILITHPGKLGDLVYSLGAIKALSEFRSKKVTLLISTYCASLTQLLLCQPYVESVLIDYDYRPVHEHRGFQPHTLDFESLSAKYSEIYEFGYREQDAYDLNSRHLKGYPFYLLNEFYHLNINESLTHAIEIPFVKNQEQEFIAFQGFGETLDVVFGPDKVNHIMMHWAAVLKASKKKIIAVTGPREVERYRKLGFETFTSINLLDTAIFLSQAKSVISSQSVVAAVANEMQLSRLILSVFPNAVPTGKNGLHIPLFDDSLVNSQFLLKWLG